MQSVSDVEWPDKACRLIWAWGGSGGVWVSEMLGGVSGWFGSLIGSEGSL